jgi:hypothetical protein
LSLRDDYHEYDSNFFGHLEIMCAWVEKYGRWEDLVWTVCLVERDENIAFVLFLLEHRILRGYYPLADRLYCDALVVKATSQ